MAVTRQVSNRALSRFTLRAAWFHVMPLYRNRKCWWHVQDSGFLASDAVSLDGWFPTFRTIVMPSSSASTVEVTLEDVDITTLQNVGNHSPSDTTSHPEHLNLQQHRCDNLISRTNVTAWGLCWIHCLTLALYVACSQNDRRGELFWRQISARFLLMWPTTNHQCHSKVTGTVYTGWPKCHYRDCTHVLG